MFVCALILLFCIKGYSTGLVVLLDVENHQEVNVFHLHSDITCLSWTQNITEIHDDIEEIHENRLVRYCHFLNMKQTVHLK